MKYFGLAFQMCAVIGIGTWIGFKIQAKSQMGFPVWLLLFLFLSTFLAFYQLYRSMKNDEEQDNKHKKP
jgi:hypothetical protein